MELLNGGLQRLFGRAFGPIYLEATLHKATLTKTPSGGFTASHTDHAARAMIDDWSDTYRADNGIPHTDLRILLLQDCLNATPTPDDEITVRGRRHRITGPVREDEARSHWDLQARPDGTS